MEEEAKVIRGGRFTFKVPTPEELGGFLAASAGPDEPPRTVAQWVALGRALLSEYEIRQKLLDGTPVSRI